MVRIFPLIFVLLWSSAFITTKPIIDNSDPFAALAFRFFFVAVGFLLFSIYLKQSILIKKRYLIESMFSGILFHGLYLGGVFYEIHGNFDYAWYASIALSIFAGVIHLPIKEKTIERVQAV